MPTTAQRIATLDAAMTKWGRSNGIKSPRRLIVTPSADGTTLDLRPGPAVAEDGGLPEDPLRLLFARGADYDTDGMSYTHDGAEETFYPAGNGQAPVWYRYPFALATVDVTKDETPILQTITVALTAGKRELVALSNSNEVFPNFTLAGVGFALNAGTWPAGSIVILNAVTNQRMNLWTTFPGGQSTFHFELYENAVLIGTYDLSKGGSMVYVPTNGTVAITWIAYVKNFVGTYVVSGNGSLTNPASLSATARVFAGVGVGTSNNPTLSDNVTVDP